MPAIDIGMRNWAAAAWWLAEKLLMPRTSPFCMYPTSTFVPGGSALMKLAKSSSWLLKPNRTPSSIRMAICAAAAGTGLTEVMGTSSLLICSFNSAGSSGAPPLACTVMSAVVGTGPSVGISWANRCSVANANPASTKGENFLRNSLDITFLHPSSYVRRGLLGTGDMTKTSNQKRCFAPSIILRQTPGTGFVPGFGRQSLVAAQPQLQAGLERQRKA